MTQQYLSQTDIETFRQEGYLVVRGMFEKPEIMKTWADQLQAFPEVPGKYMKYFEESLITPGERILSRVENFCPYHEGFNSLVNGEPILQMVSELLGEPPVLFKDKINFKLPGANGFTPHQDAQAGWEAYASWFISVFVAIDECTLENGCLEIARGYNQRGLIGKLWQPLTEGEMQNMEFAPLPAQPGDAVFFDFYAPHRSGPNLARDSRRALYSTYNRASEGDYRLQYYAAKRKSYPPDIERQPGKQYLFRV